MINIYQLNLPSPSPYFLDTINSIVQTSQMDIDAKQWFDKQNLTDNSAEYLFTTYASVDKLIQQEFGSFFQVPISGIVGIMKNSHTNSSNHSPHIDRARSLAINYYVDLGGDNVQTSFYNIVNTVNPDQAKNFTYQQVHHQRAGSVVFEKNQWYTFDTCRCHSVENIIGTRYFVAIFLKNSYKYTVDNLIQDYPNLLEKSIPIKKEPLCP